MREVAQRLVCDTCQSMQLAEADFVASLHALDGEHAPVSFDDAQPGGNPCPRCRAAMHAGNTRVGQVKVEGRVERCEQHGLWMSERQLAAAYARASRITTRAGRSVGQGKSVAQGRGYNPIPTAIGGTPFTNKGGLAAAMNSIANAFEGRRHLARATPHQHTAFVSSLRGPLYCPTCKSTPDDGPLRSQQQELQFLGDRWICPRCPGSFVEDAALTAMVMDVKQAYWEMPAPSETPGDRGCPQCRALMTVEQRGALALDRCAKHGVWFDEAELQALLLQEAAPTESDGGIRGWLGRLFG